MIGNANFTIAVAVLLSICVQQLQFFAVLLRTCASSYFSYLLSMATPQNGLDQQHAEPTDAHWDASVKDKPFRTPGSVLQHMKQATYSVSTQQSLNADVQNM